MKHSRKHRRYIIPGLIFILFLIGIATFLLIDAYHKHVAISEPASVTDPAQIQNVDQEISTGTIAVASTSEFSTLPSTATSSQKNILVHSTSTAAVPPTIIAPAPASPSPLPSPTIDQASVQPRAINPQSIVGMYCYYTPANNYTAQVFGNPIVFQLSGVIINSQGYILTAKHAVDPKWTAMAYESSSPSAELFYGNINFDYCDVGIPGSDVLPTAQQIRDINPSSLLPPMRYKATLVFDPPKGTMSDKEFDDTDFSILKITGAANDCSKSYTDCSFSGPFPYNPVLFSQLPPIGAQVLTYGYPVEADLNYELHLFRKGGAGNITSYEDGDTYFQNIPLVINWNADDVLGGPIGIGNLLEWLCDRRALRPKERRAFF